MSWWSWQNKEICRTNKLSMLLWCSQVLGNGTYQAGMPTQSSSQATMVGPFQRANGVPAFMASSSSSCFFFFRRSKSPFPARPPIPAMLSDWERQNQTTNRLVPCPHNKSVGNICPFCPTCTISVSPKWGCADRGAVTKPPLRDFNPLSFLPNILQTDKLVNKASSFEPSQQKKYSTFLERIWVPSSLRQRLQQQLFPGRVAARCARSPERFSETATISIN